MNIRKWQNGDPGPDTWVAEHSDEYPLIKEELPAGETFKQETWVAERGGGVIGMVIVNMDCVPPLMVRAYTLEDYRSKGVQRKLFHRVAEELAKFVFKVYKDNDAMLAFTEEIGARRLGESGRKNEMYLYEFTEEMVDNAG